jgi:hypothetical protein
MANQDIETVRRVLEALLRRLEAEPAKAGDAGSAVLLTEGVNTASPVIVVLGGLNSGAEHDAALRRSGVEGNERPTASTSAASAYREQPALHPGLERFELAETESHSAAPKACFMEPGRACVSSGACEMRGY